MRWFDIQLDRLARAIKPLNSRNHRIAPGEKWGHATKILTLFVRDLVLKSRYFHDKDAKRIPQFLHAPIDGIVIKRLRKLGVRLPFSKIKEHRYPKEILRCTGFTCLCRQEGGYSPCLV